MPTKINASHILVKTEEATKQVKSEIDNGKSFDEIARKNPFAHPGRREGISAGFLMAGW